MAADLLARRGRAGTLRVTLVDHSPEALASATERCRRTTGRAPRTLVADLSVPREISRLAAEHDVVLGALASRLGFATLQAVIEARRPYADISFMAEDPLELSSLARRRGVTAVVDCGVAPGMSNLLAGQATRLLEPCERLDIMVGGLPVQRRHPFQYKAAFSPFDVIEEYTRPARIVEGGRVVVREALGGIEPVDLPGVGTVEAFDTDGLRSLARTLKVPFMRERTLRWPGHAGLMKAFRDAGLFGDAPITVGRGPQAVRVSPREVTSALLFPAWQYEPGEADLTVMRVTAEGRLKGPAAGSGASRGRRASPGRSAQLSWDLLDHLDPTTGFTSMARTTAFPCTIVARLLASGGLRRPGVNPPEFLADDPRLVELVLAELRRRGVVFEASIALRETEQPAGGDSA